ncbi:hypothetical protein BAUCODRAFT_38985 [Baudoinia panamericana UAMH 10762]|uniref:Uncharacterized protein n=1 Tax=Baudoinia panamericana (strain UAMH 10762) TaxID=717646 RepID=M2MYU1_BAUPA|nr:uncharacterized protein BAUCODRAFT_38985 [Baudoinia panamericana UAMH 10762]EMC91844.1 hypothetical protein BAUCODRAFT_38985 [Baudoinia panamericana UAMH 10762]
MHWWELHAKLETSGTFFTTLMFVKRAGPRFSFSIPQTCIAVTFSCMRHAWTKVPGTFPALFARVVALCITRTRHDPTEERKCRCLAKRWKFQTLMSEESLPDPTACDAEFARRLLRDRLLAFLYKWKALQASRVPKPGNSDRWLISVERP